jgi:hypothetical protein
MCGFAAPCAARISAATSLRLADYNIMAIATQKEKLKQQKESRNFFCVMSGAFRRSSAVPLGLLPALSGTETIPTARPG